MKIIVLSEEFKMCCGAVLLILRHSSFVTKLKMTWARQKRAPAKLPKFHRLDDDGDGKKALISYKYPYIDQILPLPQHNNILTLQIRNDHLRVM